MVYYIINLIRSIGDASVAQLAVQLICNQQVAGSIPVTSSKFSLEFASNQISPQMDHTHKDLG